MTWLVLTSIMVFLGAWYHQPHSPGIALILTGAWAAAYVVASLIFRLLFRTLFG